MKLKAVYETETYISEGGYYVIKQRDTSYGENNAVSLSPSQLKELIADMTKHHVDSSWWSAENEN
jgi:hypothetical protein